MSSASSPIIWQNVDATVTLIDIPQSICNAQQDAPAGECARHLLSATPLPSPYPSTEPKSKSAKAKLAGNGEDCVLNLEYHELLRKALTEVSEHVESDWCLPRLCVEGKSRAGVKRKRGECVENPSGTDVGRDVNPMKLPKDGSVISRTSPDLVALASRDSSLYWIHSPEQANLPEETINLENYAPFNNFLINNTNSPQLLTISDMFHPNRHTFHFPPQSTFSLTNCNDPEPFHTAIGAQYPETNNHGLFNFILLDPPWPNRSVRRTHQTPGSTYDTPQTVNDVKDLLINLRLDGLMAEDCLVGVWITNKPALRECLLVRRHGLFAQQHWDLELIEEWLWLKTTMHGEPVCEIESVWRKPYEVLLLGRRRRRRRLRRGSGSEGPEEMTGEEKSDAMKQSGSGGGDDQPRRRVLIAVPDLHSRKPCLKVLVEPLMPDPSDSRALEVFARHLVAGWWSWGNECIKFNWEGCWRENGGDSGIDEELRHIESSDPET